MKEHEIEEIEYEITFKFQHKNKDYKLHIIAPAQFYDIEKEEFIIEEVDTGDVRIIDKYADDFKDAFKTIWHITNVIMNKKEV